ncbi:MULTISPECIES: ABC transporter permease subunit [unclassified Pseudoalteromonas]|uniref:ABC transporter permease subunit n=1 Tax=unclassified Pseudoalteromonas TaxID=194690 RepID=UPI0020977FEA|nr:ABC transporter permease subunit [Pseudoalteromonas sp. XMcav2-N]MCO7187270.1 ABC transporter permease subunit [Pseudoalteromonas sp. XMcav2-N]
MSLKRIMLLSQFELTRLFATKRGWLALAAFIMVWLMILRYPIYHSVSVLNSPEFSDIAVQIAGSVGLYSLARWPEAELSVYWIIALFSFPVFTLFVSADQTVEDSKRGTLRFLTLRATRSEIMLGRFAGQALILLALILASALATWVLMLTRDTALAFSGLGKLTSIIAFLVLTTLPFIALMSLLNLLASSARLSIIYASLLFTVGNLLIGYLVSHIELADWLYYLLPGVHISSIAPWYNIDWHAIVIPLLQSLALLSAAYWLMKRKDL